MNLFKKLILLAGISLSIFTLNISIVANEASTYEPIAQEQPVSEVSQSDTKNESYEPVIQNSEVPPVSLSGCNNYDLEISSNSKPLVVYDRNLFSPSIINQDWYSSDHIGYVDNAFNGARHIAYADPGFVMFGYEQPPYSDFMLKEFELGDKTINVIQAPYRADWHTFKGNGILFNVTLSGSFEKSDNTPQDNLPTIASGYFLCAEKTDLVLYQLQSVNLNALVEDSIVLDSATKLWSEPKQCPAQNFTIAYKNGVATIYLGTRIVYEGALQDGNYAGLLSCFSSHNCTSLSSVYYNNFTYNNVDYLKGGEAK